MEIIFARPIVLKLCLLLSTTTTTTITAIKEVKKSTKDLGFRELTPAYIQCDSQVLDLRSSFTRSYTALIRTEMQRTVEDVVITIALAQHQQFPGGEVILFKNETYEEDGWKFKLPEKANLETELTADTDNRELMAVGISKLSVQCSDGGIYFCNTTVLADTGLVAISGYLSIRVDAFVGVRSIDSKPDRPLEEHGTDKTFGYYPNEEVVLTCNAIGPEARQVKIAWKWHCTDTSAVPEDAETEDVTVEDDVINADDRARDCPTAAKTKTLRSTLKFGAVKKMTGCKIGCSFKGKKRDVRQVHIVVDENVEAKAVTQNIAPKATTTAMTPFDQFAQDRRITILTISTLVVLALLLAALRLIYGKCAAMISKAKEARGRKMATDTSDTENANDRAAVVEEVKGQKADKRADAVQGVVEADSKAGIKET